MTSKVLAMIVEQFWHLYWTSYCKKKLGQQRRYFNAVLLQIHICNCLQKNWHTRHQLDCKTDKGQFFMPHSVDSSAGISIQSWNRCEKFSFINYKLQCKKYYEFSNKHMRFVRMFPMITKHSEYQCDSVNYWLGINVFVHHLLDKYTYKLLFVC